MTTVLLPDMAAAYAERDRRDKRVSTLQARAALAGYSLHVISDAQAEFLMVRWGLTRTLRDAGEVEAFLDRVGAPT